MAKITAFNVKTKQKGCPMFNAVITRTSKGAYMAQGDDGNGQRMTALITASAAQDAVKTGDATLAPGVKFENIS